MQSSITVNLKVRGVGGSRFGVWVLGRVAKFFKIKLEVIEEGEDRATIMHGIDEAQIKTAADQMYRDQVSKERRRA